MRKIKYAKKEAKRYDGDEDEEWFYTRFLDEMIGIVDENKIHIREKFDEKLSLYT